MPMIQLSLPAGVVPYHHAIESIIRLGLGELWCRKVLYSNAVNLFRSNTPRVLSSHNSKEIP